MAKKLKQPNFIEKLTLENIKSGMIIQDSTKNPQDWEIDNDLIEPMRRYEQETSKSAIWRNRITSRFLYFKYCKDNTEFLEEKEKSIILYLNSYNGLKSSLELIIIKLLN